MRSGSTDPAMKKARAALMIYLALIFPLSAVLPPWVSFENGPVENAQAVILAAFGVMCLNTGRQRCGGCGCRRRAFSSF